MYQLPARSPACYENYPPVSVPSPQSGIAWAFGRGSVAGMASAASTVVALVPPRIWADAEPSGVAVITIVSTVIAAALGALPGAVVGGLLAALARAGAPPLAVRLLGGSAAAIVAAVVGAPLHLVSWPGLMVAALCGGFAARWVASGRHRITLA